MKKIAIKALRIYINTLVWIAPMAAGRKAFEIFCTPRQGRLNEKQRKFLETAQQWHALSYEGEKIQCYEWYGTGPRVLLAHGWDSNSARWRNQILSLVKANFNVVCVDGPAHGASGGRFFTAVKYAHCLAQAVDYYKPHAIVGHSVGGYATIYFLANMPHQIQRAVVLGVPSCLDKIFDKYITFMGFSELVRLAMYQYFEAKYGFSVQTLNAHDFAKRITIKGLVIADTNDEVCPLSENELIATNWNDATLFVTEKLGHGYQDRKAYHAVRDFLLS